MCALRDECVHRGDEGCCAASNASLSGKQTQSRVYGSPGSTRTGIWDYSSSAASETRPSSELGRNSVRNGEHINGTSYADSEVFAMLLFI